MPPCKSLTLFTNCVVRSKVQDRLVCQSAHTACGQTPQATLSTAGTSKPFDTRTVQGGTDPLCRCAPRAYTNTHTHETRGKAIRLVNPSCSTHGTLPPGRVRVSSDNIAAPGKHTQLGGISPRSNTRSVHITPCTVPLRGPAPLSQSGCGP